MKTNDADLIKECCEHSRELLLRNSSASGVIACAVSEKAVDRGYASIFGRDAAICSLGMIASGDRKLIGYAKKGILTLAAHQAPNGQIPKYVRPESREVDFWYSGCIDATLWWLIAVDFCDRSLPESGFKNKLNKKIRKALNWLTCQEHQGMYLLQQNEASDWADIMPRSGFVLYSNALWHHVKIIFNIPTSEKTRHFLRHIFFPFNKACSEHRRAKIMTEYIRNGALHRDFYLSFVNFSFWGDEVDVFGNILTCLFDIPTARNRKNIVNALLAKNAHNPMPVRSVLYPIQPGDLLWRRYMERHNQNFPNQYHNGGIWPFVAGFWVMLLAKSGKRALAGEELKRYAETCARNNWEFNEWFHGGTGEPMGMAGQSWNAAMFIMACKAVEGKGFFSLL